jgi:hypothetical protein
LREVMGRLDDPVAGAFHLIHLKRRTAVVEVLQIRDSAQASVVVIEEFFEVSVFPRDTAGVVY